MNKKSLTKDEWDDFLVRLKHDCVGAGVNEHYTSDAIFVVEYKHVITGIDTTLNCGWVMMGEDGELLFSPNDYWNYAEASRKLLDKTSQDALDSDFLQLEWDDQWGILKYLFEDKVFGYQDKWEYINFHFTQKSADDYVAKNNRHYPYGLRVAVESQESSIEFTKIKNAILDGQLIFVNKD